MNKPVIYDFSLKIKNRIYRATVVLPAEKLLPLELVIEKFSQCQRLMQDNIDFNEETKEV